MSAPDAKHTFVVLAYKESEYLEACIQSVLLQTLKSKIIIATSTPNNYIQSLADKYKLQVLVNNNAGSIGKDWNFGYRCADTRYVTLAHQDDIYHLNFAAQCVSAAEQNWNGKPLMVFTRSITYKGDKRLRVSFKNILRWLFIFPFHFKKAITSKAIKKSVLYFSNSISCPGVCYVKENLGDFQFNETEKYILDWRAWYHFSQMEGAMIYVPDKLHSHREHQESATSSTDIKTLQQEEFELLSEIWGNKFMARIITKILTLAK